MERESYTLKHLFSISSFTAVILSASLALAATATAGGTAAAGCAWSGGHGGGGRAWSGGGKSGWPHVEPAATGVAALGVAVTAVAAMERGNRGGRNWMAQLECRNWNAEMERSQLERSALEWSKTGASQLEWPQRTLAEPYHSYGSFRIPCG